MVDNQTILNCKQDWRGAGSAQYPDSHQIFVGNLPHSCIERDLEELFGKYGKVRNLIKSAGHQISRVTFRMSHLQTR